MTTTATRTVRAGTVIQDPETGATWTTNEAGDVVKVGGTGILARIGGFFRGLWNSVKSGWNWLRKTLHLDAVTERVKAGYRWALDKAKAGIRFLGGDGIFGLGLLSISTRVGRDALRFLFRPVGWVLRQLGRAYIWLEEAIDNEGKGGIRTWIADRMVDGREFFFGNGKHKHGIIPGFFLWVGKTFGPHLDVDSRAMRILRAIGTFLFGRALSSGLVAHFATAATIGWMMPLSTLVVIGLTLAPFAPEMKSAYDIAREKFRSTAKEADEIMTVVDADVKATTAEAAALATGHVVKPNRTQERAAEKAPPKRSTPTRRR